MCVFYTRGINLNIVFHYIQYGIRASSLILFWWSLLSVGGRPPWPPAAPKNSVGSPFFFLNLCHSQHQSRPSVPLLSPPLSAAVTANSGHRRRRCRRRPPSQIRRVTCGSGPSLRATANHAGFESHLSVTRRHAALLSDQSAAALSPATVTVPSGDHWIWFASSRDDQPHRCRRLILSHAPPRAASMFAANRRAPFAAVQAPFAAVQAPFAAVQAPFAAVQAPFAAVQAPFAAVQAPFAAVQAPFAAVQAPFAAVQAPFAAVQAPFAAVQAPFAAVQAPFAAVQAPFAAVQAPFAAVQAPFAAVQAPFAAVQAPFAAVQAPFAAVQAPFAAVQAPFAAVQAPFAAVQAPYASNNCRPPSPHQLVMAVPVVLSLPATTGPITTTVDPVTHPSLIENQSLQIVIVHHCFPSSTFEVEVSQGAVSSSMFASHS
ncbi:hypothetical protein LR48_Vigan08g031300 [Vigna angularis]|uniref:Uncharacterized protein n=1 Tax=Phaseolus angularis TaxID=3914 RepID=A0A0L9V3F9_PHAAN|nr:hypothetical protein LR48_Vigan08g031300 [Vigna angularis]